MRLAAAILAGGYSSRMGEFKPLMQLGDRTVLGHCAEVFRQAGVGRILVVTGYRAPEVEDEAARLGLSVIHNPNYDLGMFASVQAAACQMADVDGVFVLPVDIPLVRPATVKAQVAAFDGRAVVYPVFAGRRGHPPLIPAHLIPAIRGFGGQGGLRALLENVESHDLPVWDRGIHLDADTQEDFSVLIQRLARLKTAEEGETQALANLVMPVHTMLHGKAVAEVAVCIGREMNRHGFDLDLVLIHNAALLHDVAKGQPQHEARGAAFLKSLGLDALAEIVAFHKDISPPESENLTEKEIVCLADKLIKGTHRVSITQRFSEKLLLYRSDAEACRVIQSRLANALALQSSVERIIGYDIETLLHPLASSNPDFS